MEGILIGFGEKVASNLISCVHDDTVDFKAIKDAIRKINSRFPRKVLKGIKELAHAIKHVPTDI